jgi:hypothetical protein
MLRSILALGAFALLMPLAPSQTFLPQPKQLPPTTERPAAPAPERAPPKLEAVAETKLLMEGLAKVNFDGLGKLLKDKPTDAENWTFARGQALIIAETGNLLMLRPPKGKAAQDAWLGYASDMKNAAAQLAKSAGEKDYLNSRANLMTLSNTCNRCHEKFGLKIRVAPFGE